MSEDIEVNTKESVGSAGSKVDASSLVIEQQPAVTTASDDNAGEAAPVPGDDNAGVQHFSVSV